MICLLAMTACEAPELNPIERSTLSAHPAMLQVWHDPNAYEVQILFTEIDRDDQGTPTFTEYSFKTNDSVYFYPASTVKLPAAILALEKISNASDITRETRYTLPGDSSEYSLSSDIKQIFAVSDNDAYNRIYEWLGRDYMNEALQKRGISPIRLAHRLSTEDAARSQRDTVTFKLTHRDTTFVGNDRTLTPLPNLRKIKKGKAFMRQGDRVPQPMDFSEKNYLPLQSLHDITKRVFFPETFPPEQRFSLSEDNRRFLIQQMKTVPRKEGYNETDYPDSFGKFFMYGDTKDRIPEHIHIYNKVGYAYGTLTETAYIHDTERQIEFLLSATLLVNKNQIFNDNTYEFETVGIPFLAQLGREMYLHMLQR